MAFILFFVVTALAIPLIGEIYKNGSNNVLLNSLEDAKDIAERIGIGRASSSARATAKGIAGFVKGTFALVLFLFLVAFVLKFIYSIAAFVLLWLFG